MSYELTLPNLGENIDSADVVHVFVDVGDVITTDQDLIEVETGKASMPIPSTVDGTVKEVRVKEGDSLNPSQVLFIIDTDSSEAPSTPAVLEQEEEVLPEKTEDETAAEPASATNTPVIVPGPKPAAASGDSSHTRAIPASPSVRRFARELGIDITLITGTGTKGRIIKDDVKEYSRRSHSAGGAIGAAAGSGGIVAKPLPDLARFGSIHSEKLSGIRKVTSEHMSHCWNNIPHVTHYDKADITDLEKLRKQIAPKLKISNDGKLTVTAILLKITAIALKRFPKFNSSYDSINQEIVYKDYVHIGVAVDTPKGLVVPVIRDVDQKTITELSGELGKYSALARDGKLSLDDMQGGCFTISNLGGIGGHAFTPIVNWPEVAILGVSRGEQEPVFKDGAFVPRMRLPLSMSYDHRVIDGADAARFMRWVCNALEEPLMLHI